MNLPIVVEPKVDLTTHKYLKKRWLSLCKESNIPTKKSDLIFEEILKYYKESHRAYHNLNHIYSIFQILDQYFTISNPLLEAAIWFHDIIYTIGEPQNEKKSAILAKELLKDFFTKEELITIENLIVSTAKHIPIMKGALNKIMLDIDLAILGADTEIYTKYIEAIRFEYKIYPEPLYKLGRKAAMSRFLERSNLFYTDTFQTHFEAKARRNVQLEIFGQD